MVMTHDVDPAEALKKELGDISNVEIFNNQVLVAVYIRPNKTKSGIYLSDKTTDEDRFQSKVGLLVKAGDSAFVADDQWFVDTSFGLGDWLVFKPSDGWSITVNGVLCRILDDVNVRGRVDNPDRVW
jgi:co-chaperonin GroES (HSP10)